MPFIASAMKERSARKGLPSTKKILVTGGAGFIGSHLCTRLIADGHAVVCVDNFSTGSIANISHLRDNEKFSLIEHDITQPLHVEVEQIYNLACPASPIHYQRDPIRTVKTSVLGALNMLELARWLAVPILQTSTSEVYGDPMVHPQTELYWGNVNPIGRRSCYDEGKRCAESMFFDYWRQYGVSIKIGRLFNTYGPNMHPGDGRVVSNFLVQALQNEPITVFGNGQQTRSFCYVDDMIGALVLLMNTPVEFCGPVNLGNPEEFTILELVDLVREITDSSTKAIFHPLPEDDPRQRKPDISLAKAVLGWEPGTCLRDGLLMTARYFEESLQLAAHPLHAAEQKSANFANPALFGGATRV